jgi:hypothetical protein
MKVETLRKEKWHQINDKHRRGRGGAGTVKCACATRTGNRRLTPARPPRNTQHLLLALTAQNRDQRYLQRRGSRAAATANGLSSAQAALLARREYLPSKFLAAPTTALRNLRAALRATLNISSLCGTFIEPRTLRHAARLHTHGRTDVATCRRFASACASCAAGAGNLVGGLVCTYQLTEADKSKHCTTTAQQPTGEPAT